MNSFLTLAVVLLLAIAGPHSAHGMTFSACPRDVETYFAQLYPEYTGSSSGRRLREAEDEENDLESQLFDRTKLKSASSSFPAGESSKPQRTASLSENGLKDIGYDGEQVPNNHGVPTTPVSKRDVFLAPPNAWNKVRMAVSGCTSCEHGCCNAVDITLDCGRMSVPLNWDNATEGGNITTMTYRVRINRLDLQPTQTKQLWMLQGGPGGSGLSILFIAVPSLEFANEIYIPDHRGTGFSATLSCPTVISNQGAIPPTSATRCTQEAEQCDEFGTRKSVDSKLYTVTFAARDLAAQINAQRTTDVPVYVHGYSYGTRWATRLLQLYPKIANKVVLEGSVAKDTVFNDFALGSQSAGVRFMEKCQLTEKCSKYFTSSVLEQIAKIAREGNSNDCTNLFMGTSTAYSESDIKMQIQQLLFQGLSFGVDGPYQVSTTEDVFLDFRTVFLSLVSRWSNCRENRANYRVFSAGIAWYLSLNGGYAGVAAINAAQDFSNLVYEIIVASELRRYPVESAEAYNALRASSEWGVYDTYPNYFQESTLWRTKKYEDALVGIAPSEVETVLLVLNGEIDGNTFASQALSNYEEISMKSGFAKRIALVPDAGHHVSGQTCGKDVAKAFYTDAPTPSCAFESMDTPAEPLGTGFELHPSLSSVILGNPASPFEGDVQSSYCMNPPTASPTSGAAIRYCRKCFDYCIFLNFVQETTACDCAHNYGACLNHGKVANPAYECLVYLTSYGDALQYTPYKAGGQCRKVCESGVSSGFMKPSAAGKPPFVNAVVVWAVIFALWTFLG